MADYGSPIGGLLQGFNQTYWPAMRQNQALALQQAQEKRAQALQDAQLAEIKRKNDTLDATSGGLLRMLGQEPTYSVPEAMPMDESGKEQFGPSQFTKQVANPEYESMKKMDPTVLMSMIKTQHEKNKERWLSGGEGTFLDTHTGQLVGEPRSKTIETAILRETDPTKRAQLIALHKQLHPAKSGGEGGLPKGAKFWISGVDGDGYSKGDGYTAVFPRNPQDRPWSASGDNNAAKAAANAEKYAQALDGQYESAQRMRTEIKESLDLAKASSSATGFGSDSIASLNSVSDAATLRNKIDFIKSSIGLDRLQEMKRLSPNGASGLGQQTDKELAALQMALGNLKPNMRKEEFVKQLERVQGHYDKVLNNLEKMRGAPEAQAQTTQGAGLSPSEQQELESLRKRFGSR